MQWLIPSDSEVESHVQCCISLQAFVTATDYEPLINWHRTLKLGYLKTLMFQFQLDEALWNYKTAENEAKKAKSHYENAQYAASAANDHAIGAKECKEEAELYYSVTKLAYSKMRLLFEKP